MEENHDNNSEEEEFDEEAPEETEKLEEGQEEELEEEPEEELESDVDEEILADLQDLDKDIGPITPIESFEEESTEEETPEDEISEEESTEEETPEDEISEEESTEEETPEDEISEDETLEDEISEDETLEGEPTEEFMEDESKIGGDALEPEESLEKEGEEGNEVEFEEGFNEGGEGTEEIDSNSDVEGDFGIEESSKGDDIEGEDIEGIEQFSQEEQLSEKVDSHSRLKNVVEGALFVAGRPVSIEELNAKTNIGKRDLESFLEELCMDYLVRSTALELVAVQDKFSLQIKPEYTPNVKKFATGGLIPDRILKTLTIIALKQPLMKSMLIKLRGSTAYEHVKFLIDRGYIDARKKGRSHELMTTDQFADTFGLSRDIPTLKKEMILQLELQDG
ncbi:MAG: SMC-Scp complex subunit ScpB [Promethearchaeota archaeon]